MQQKIIPTTIKFSIPKEIDYTKFIEPKYQIFETINGRTTANLVSKIEYENHLKITIK